MKPAEDPVVTAMRSIGTSRPMSVGVVAGDAGAERAEAEGLGVGKAAVIEGGPRRGEHRPRRRRTRLADLHVNDALARRLAVDRGAHHLHDQEGLDRAPE